MSKLQQAVKQLALIRQYQRDIDGYFSIALSLLGNRYEFPCSRYREFAESKAFKIAVKQLFPTDSCDADYDSLKRISFEKVGPITLASLVKFYNDNKKEIDSIVGKKSTRQFREHLARLFLEYLQQRHHETSLPLITQITLIDKMILQETYVENGLIGAEGLVDTAFAVCLYKAAYLTNRINEAKTKLQTKLGQLAEAKEPAYRSVAHYLLAYSYTTFGLISRQRNNKTLVTAKINNTPLLILFQQYLALQRGVKSINSLGDERDIVDLLKSAGELLGDALGSDLASTINRVRSASNVDADRKKFIYHFCCDLDDWSHAAAHLAAINPSHLSKYNERLPDFDTNMLWFLMYLEPKARTLLLPKNHNQHLQGLSYLFNHSAQKSVKVFDEMALRELFPACQQANMFLRDERRRLAAELFRVFSRDVQNTLVESAASKPVYLTSVFKEYDFDAEKLKKYFPELILDKKYHLNIIDGAVGLRAAIDDYVKTGSNMLIKGLAEVIGDTELFKKIKMLMFNPMDDIRIRTIGFGILLYDNYHPFTMSEMGLKAYQTMDFFWRGIWFERHQYSDYAKQCYRKAKEIAERYPVTELGNICLGEPWSQFILGEMAFFDYLRLKQVYILRLAKNVKSIKSNLLTAYTKAKKYYTLGKKLKDPVCARRLAQLEECHADLAKKLRLNDYDKQKIKPNVMNLYSEAYQLGDTESMKCLERISADQALASRLDIRVEYGFVIGTGSESLTSNNKKLTNQKTPVQAYVLSDEDKDTVVRNYRRLFFSRSSLKNDSELISTKDKLLLVALKNGLRHRGRLEDGSLSVKSHDINQLGKKRKQVMNDVEFHQAQAKLDGAVRDFNQLWSASQPALDNTDSKTPMVRFAEQPTLQIKQ